MPVADKILDPGYNQAHKELDFLVKKFALQSKSMNEKVKYLNLELSEIVRKAQLHHVYKKILDNKN